MSETPKRKFIKTKFEGVFYRLSSKRDPQTGEYDRIYCFWFTDARRRGHWKTVGRHSQGVRPATARNERARFLANLVTGPNAHVSSMTTVGQAVDGYVAWMANEGKSLRRLSLYRGHLQAQVHSLPISDLTPALLSKLKAQLLDSPRRVDKIPSKKLAPATVYAIFTVMRSAINWAMANGMWHGKNPLSTQSSIWKMPKFNNSRLRFLSKDEARKLLEYLQGKHQMLHDIILLSLKTGLRPTEMFKIKGRDIDEKAKIVYIIEKGGNRAPVHVPKDMIDMLISYNRLPNEYIFKNEKTGNQMKATPRYFKKAVRALGLEAENEDSLYIITLHTMRHTFASWLAQSGKITLIELQKLMRHKAITMTMRYAHLIPGQESEKLSIIDDIIG